MRLGLVFNENPIGRAPGPDTVRLAALGQALAKGGVAVEIIAPVPDSAVWQGLTVHPPEHLQTPGRYDILKTCYHQSIKLIGRHQGPVVSRLVRIVDQHKPRHDEKRRAELMDCQALVARRAQAVALNNRLNAERWQRLYNPDQEIVFTPTGCPAKLPEPGPDPYSTARPVVLFLGSASAGRQVSYLNLLADRLADRAELHFIGRNKTALYGREEPLSDRVLDHGPLAEADIWGYLRQADIGLALAYGPDPFENDIAKIINYLRAGLPVVCEERIIQAELVEARGMGRVFAYDRPDDLAAACLELLSDPPSAEDRRRTADWAARTQSWTERAQVYLDLFQRLSAAWH